MIKQNIIKIGIVVLVSWGFKLLLIPAYFSTDFAVHQNWLRITYNLPLSEWYYNNESKWTLDYPPFFAYFQYVLAAIAQLVSPSITSTINQLPETIIFQRLSVIVTDLLYLWAIVRFYPQYQPQQHKTLRVVLLYFSISFLILDNIHFQYNMFLQSFLVISIGYMTRKQYLLAALWYSVLLNFKHIYLYCAPAYFIYLLKQYVLSQQQDDDQTANSGNLNKSNNQSESTMGKFVKLAAATLIPFALSFGPFMAIGGLDEIKQILSRLFPFSRGLVHDYWAPNAWALYLFIDKVLFFISNKLKMSQGFQMHVVSNGSELHSLKVLPNVSPSMTLLITLIFLGPILIKAFRTKVSFPLLVGICGLIFFMFGFHVHEKAITPYLNILFMFCPQTAYLNAAIFVNIVNLIPLLIGPSEKVLSISLCFMWLALWEALNSLNSSKAQTEVSSSENSSVDLMRVPNLTFFSSEEIKKILAALAEHIIAYSGMMIIFYHLLIHPLIKKPELQFLPLMINSVWAAALNLSWTASLYLKFIRA